jgi:hypothetical protein
MHIFIRIAIETRVSSGYDLAHAGIAGIKSSLKLRRFVMKKSFAIALLAGLLTGYIGSSGNRVVPAHAVSAEEDERKHNAAGY